MAVPFAALASTGLGLLGIGNQLSNQAQQQENFNEQMKFARYQYEDSKRYNSMSEQVKRMRAAGINPALAISSGQLGTSSSMASQPSAPNFDSLPVGDIMQGASSLLGVGSLNRLNTAKAVGEETDNQTRMLKNGLTLMEMMERVRNLSYLNKKDKFLLDKLPDTWLADYNHKVFQTNLFDAQARNQEQQNNLTSELVDQAKFKTQKQQELFSKEMAEADSRIFNNYMSARAAGLSAEAAMQQARTAMWNFFTGFDGMYLPESQRKEFIEQKLRLLRAQGDMFKPEKWANILGSLGAGVLTGFGVGKFFKGFKAAKHIKGFH